MPVSRELPPDEIERLRELARVGSAWAGRALAGAVGRPVLSRAPALRDAGDPLRTGAGSSAILFEASGDLRGVVALLLGRSSRRHLVRLLLGPGRGPEGDAADSALCELGNIVASQAVSAIADTLASRIWLSVPALVSAGAEAALAARAAVHDAHLRFETELFDREGELHAALVLLPAAPKEAAAGEGV
jgi:chemotaxis protein CheY-P-specific phosphatase CheC